MNKDRILDIAFIINLGLLLGCIIVCLACPRQYYDILIGFAKATGILFFILIVVLTMIDHENEKKYKEQQYWNDYAEAIEASRQQANNIKG